MIRYQTHTIVVPAGTDGHITPYEHELYREMGSLIGVSIRPLNMDDATQGIGSIAIKSPVGYILDATPLHFFVTNYMYWLPIHSQAEGKNITIEITSTNISTDQTWLITYLLSDKPDSHAKPWRYYWRTYNLPALTSGDIHKIANINTPTEYKYISGVWTTVRIKKKGHIYGVMRPAPLLMSIRDYTDFLRLDYVPLDLLQKDASDYNHNKRYYPVNITAGTTINIELKAVKDIPEMQYDIIMLLTNEKQSF